MTREEFDKVTPKRTILSVHTDEGDKKMLVKFFMCNSENFDGYWMCCTEDLSNPYPEEFTDDDWNVYPDKSEIIEF